MSDLNIVFEFVLVQISVAFSPGLIIALVINESVQKGRKNGLQVAIGAASGAVFITLISAGVLTFVFNLIPEILTLIYIFGTLYILYKGFVTIKSEVNSKNIKLKNNSFKAGLKVNLINPKMWVFYLSVLPIFVTDSNNLLLQLIYLGFITIFINLMADISYAFLSSYFFKDSSNKVKKLINTFSGTSLILIGSYLIFSRFV